MVRVRAVLLVCLLALPVSAARERLAVLQLSSDGPATERLARAVQEHLLEELSRGGRFEVLGSSDLALLLGVERQRELLQCADGDSCAAELLGALNAPWALSGGLVKVGDKLRLDLKLLSTREAKVKARAGKLVDSEEAVFSAASQLLADVLAQLDGKPPGVATSAQGPAPSRGWAPWIVGGAGLLAVGVGAVLMGTASAGVSSLEAQTATSASSYLSQQQSSLQRQYWIGFGLAVAGGLALVTSAAMLFSSGPPSVEVGVWAAPGTGAVTVGGRW